MLIIIKMVLETPNHEELNVDTTPIDWFMDLRRFGGCVHSGFGMGFERLIMYFNQFI